MRPASRLGILLLTASLGAVVSVLLYTDVVQSEVSISKDAFRAAFSA